MENIADKVIDELASFWRERAKNFVEKVATSTPSYMIDIEFTAYNFMVIKLTIEHKSAWFSQISCGVLIQLKRDAVPLESIPETLPEIDREIRLRIPDKYLEAKGW